jgi:MoxR-like ATPase
MAANEINYQITADSTDPYKPDDDLLAAINTALFLKRPLLLAGDPGTGKTECANFVARQLKKQFSERFARDTAIRFDTKSVSQSTDLFYYYDAVGHFGDSQKPREKFISFNSLGLAILGTQGKDDKWSGYRGYAGQITVEPTGSVVLIDEIDKAPRDFPNDLLAELEEPPFKFRIREMDDIAVEQNTAKPVFIIITSNNEKGLPDAFLRRCVFHHIRFPEKENLLKIIESKLGSNENFGPAVDAFIEIRRRKDINKLPATSELIDWIKCLEEKGLLTRNVVDLKKVPKVSETLGTIAKSKVDVDILKKDFNA